MRVAVRGYGNGRLIFDEVVDSEIWDLEWLAKSQIERVVQYKRNMIEIEFIEDAPDPNRFFRFGSDKSRMVLPMGFKWKVTRKRKRRKR